jgi:ATP-binding protein involved in chromosome partitioning
VSDDKVSRNAFLEFAGNVARSTSMRNAHMKTEQIAEVVED